jgi:hypothetical protein
MFSIKRSFLAIAVCGLMAWGAAACGSDDDDGPTGPTGPTAGTLTVTLDTPNADDGAILFGVTGPDMTQIAASDPALYFRYAQDGSEVTAVLVGDLADGALITFRVPDIDAAASYVATIDQVADQGNELRDPLAGYTLTVE